MRNKLNNQLFPNKKLFLLIRMKIKKIKILFLKIVYKRLMKSMKKLKKTQYHKKI